MAVKTYRPITPARRQMTSADFSGLTKKKPEKALLSPLSKSGGRNAYGRITVRHRGGGAPRKYRVIDFKRDKDGVPGKVAALEYDPNRSAYIALIHYKDGDKRYILAPNGLRPGDEVFSGAESDIKAGNCLPLANIPVGTIIHNIELKPGVGAQIVRSAGSAAQLMAKEGAYAQVRLPSGEVRMVRMNCRASIGQVSNIENENLSIGKAGRKRWMGRRSKVRGVVMNPVDHPHGGGEGKAPIGRPGPVTPWGRPTLGYKTRMKKHPGDKFIIKRRNVK